MPPQLYKYPRTPHLSFSPGVTEDDLKLDRQHIFANCQVVVTEKLDGENTTAVQVKVLGLRRIWLIIQLSPSMP
jgi:hypothetical protein